MKIRPFTCFLCAVALILAALSPFLLQSFYYEQPESIPYKGILTLWNITGWRTGGSSCLSFLKKRAEEFESKNAFVFIDVEDKTITGAKEALSNGKTPDMISYPLGVDLGLELYPLPHEEALFLQITSCTYPFMCGGYCMLANTDMLDRQGLLVPEDRGIRPSELQNIAKLGVCFDSEDGYSALPAAALYDYTENEGPNISTWGIPKHPEAALSLTAAGYSGGLKTFCEERAGILIASHRQLFEAQMLFDDNKFPAFSAYAISGYTDMAQMVGVCSNNDQKKLSACTEFARYLISDPVQMKLEALGTFPVLRGLEIYRDNRCLYFIYAMLSENLYLADPKDKQILDELAKESLGGNKYSLKKLRSMFENS